MFLIVQTVSKVIMTVLQTPTLKLTHFESRLNHILLSSGVLKAAT